ncbi:hypothetical protein IC611_06135 [Proteus mirabilis]
MRNLTASIILAIGLTGSAFADTTPAKQTEQPATTVPLLQPLLHRERRLQRLHQQQKIRQRQRGCSQNGNF